MSDKATLEINGAKYEFPLIKGTENEVAIDIKIPATIKLTAARTKSKAGNSCFFPLASAITGFSN